MRSLQVTPSHPQLAAGSVAQLSAIAIYSDNAHGNVTDQVSWTTSNPKIASIGATTGKVVAGTPGTAILVANLHGQTAASTVTVTSASLVSIAITLLAPNIPTGTLENLTATGTFSDRTTQNLTSDVKWTSSNISVASIGSGGTVDALEPGTTTITATCELARGTAPVSASVTVTVTPATLVSLAITPSAPSIALGTMEQFIATGTYSDNSTHNVTTQVTWVSGTPSVATLSNAARSAGLATPVLPGTTPITAFLGDIASAETILTVTPATLVSIAITPPAPSIALGTMDQFIATGTYSDESTQNLTSQVTWSSGTPAVATISNAIDSAGLATAVLPGTTPITAAFSDITSAETILTITPATLISISITPTAPTIALGTSVQFIATGKYSDHSTQNLTSQVTWSSGTPAVATISNTAESGGISTPSEAGTTAIIAALGAVTSAETILTVRPATLVSIAINPAAPSIALGTSEQFIATGTYSDSSTQNLTTQVTWVSGAPSVATLSNAAGSAGMATSLSVGTAQLTALMGNVSSSPIDLIVTPAKLVSLAVTPGGPSIPVAGTEQFIATGTYSDNSTQILTSSVTWNSSDPTVAAISNAAQFAGLATGLAVGSASVSATLEGIFSLPITLAIVAQQYLVLYSFGSATDGAFPYSGFIQGLDGNFYGTTYAGGMNGGGTIYQITPGGVESVLWSFGSGTDGQNPIVGLTQGIDGNLYGTTSAGGANGGGTIYQITPGGVESVLWSFGGAGDGNTPYAELIQGSDGNFYGTTFAGGANGYGTVFEFSPGGSEVVLWSFGAGTDGAGPIGQLTQDANGNIYGTTYQGGANDYGTFFKLTPGGTESVLWSFGSGTDGQLPSGKLTQDADGNIYGTTYQGGVNGAGTVFKLTTGGIESLLWSFGNGIDGQNPNDGIVQGLDGNFYGTTVQGGINGGGTIYQITPGGIETVLWSFGSGTDGVAPYGQLIQGIDGNFYGTTLTGGANGAGTAFRF